METRFHIFFKNRVNKYAMKFKGKQPIFSDFKGKS